ncbi:MAG: hypothetical protein J7K71_04860, partial [Candidatus Omnitrophica bacterium]|nr:hypothetical protein [Candidatus Omnitrophota bacterium]
MSGWREKIWVKVVSCLIVGIFLFSEFAWTRNLNFANLILSQLGFYYKRILPQKIYPDFKDRDNIWKKISEFFLPSASAKVIERYGYGEYNEDDGYWKEDSSFWKTPSSYYTGEKHQYFQELLSQDDTVKKDDTVKENKDVIEAQKSKNLPSDDMSSQKRERYGITKREEDIQRELFGELENNDTVGENNDTVERNIKKDSTQPDTNMPYPPEEEGDYSSEEDNESSYPPDDDPMAIPYGGTGQQYYGYAYHEEENPEEGGGARGESDETRSYLSDDKPTQPDTNIEENDDDPYVGPPSHPPIEDIPPMPMPNDKNSPDQGEGYSGSTNNNVYSEPTIDSSQNEYNCAVNALYELLKEKGISKEEIAEYLALLEHSPPLAGEKTSLYALQKAAEHFGLDFKALKATYEALIDLDKPFIAHLNINNQGHFVLVTKVTDDTVTYIDNGKEKTVSGEEFESLWSGYVLSEQAKGEILGEEEVEGIKGSGDPNLIDYNGTVYVIEDGKRYGITSPEHFNSLGYDWNAIRKVDSNEFNKYQDGGIKGQTVEVTVTSDGSTFIVNGRPVNEEEGKVTLLAELWNPNSKIIIDDGVTATEEQPTANINIANITLINVPLTEELNEDIHKGNYSSRVPERNPSINYGGSVENNGVVVDVEERPENQIGVINKTNIPLDNLSSAIHNPANVVKTTVKGDASQTEIRFAPEQTTVTRSTVDDTEVASTQTTTLTHSSLGSSQGDYVSHTLGLNTPNFYLTPQSPLEERAGLYLKGELVYNGEITQDNQGNILKKIQAIGRGKGEDNSGNEYSF